MQEFFLKLFRSPPTEPIQKPRAYLFRMARNMALDGLKKRRDSAPLEEGHKPAECPDFAWRVDVADAPADGGEGNGAAEALNAEWQYYKAVPDYSSGYWLDEAGVLTVGLVDEAGREEVLAIVGNVPVNFEEHVYSYNELWNIQLAIEPFMNENVGIMTVGVNVRDNVTEVGIDMEVPGAEGFVEKMLARYGGRVAFKDKTGLTLDYVKGEASSAAKRPFPAGACLPRPW